MNARLMEHADIELWRAEHARHLHVGRHAHTTGSIDSGLGACHGNLLRHALRHHPLSHGRHDAVIGHALQGCGDGLCDAGTEEHGGVGLEPLV